MFTAIDNFQLIFESWSTPYQVSSSVKKPVKQSVLGVENDLVTSALFEKLQEFPIEKLVFIFRFFVLWQVPFCSLNCLVTQCVVQVILLLQPP